MADDEVLRSWIDGELKEITTNEQFIQGIAQVESLPKWKPADLDAYKALKGWQKTQVIEAMAAKPAYSYKFPHSEVTPVPGAELDNIDWSTVVQILRSDSGSEGVLFVELADKRAVVVKSPSKIAAEYYGTWLCEELNINCPAMSLVVRSSETGQAMFAAFEKADEARAPSDRIVREFFGNKQAVLVIEYLQADELANKFVPLSDQGWSAETFGFTSTQSPGELSENGCKALEDFGSLVAFDMLINNFDRLPCIWDNDGNPGNVMFAKADHRVVSIDNMVCCINKQHTKAIDNFCARVEQTVTKVFAEPDKPHLEFKRMATLLADGCQGHGWPGLGLDIGDEGIAKIQSGFLTAVSLVVSGAGGSETALNREALQQHYDTVSEIITGGDSKDTAGLEAIDIDFFDAVLQCWKRGMEEGERSAKNDAMTRTKTTSPNAFLVVKSGKQLGKARANRLAAMYVVDGEEVSMLSDEARAAAEEKFEDLIASQAHRTSARKSGVEFVKPDIVAKSEQQAEARALAAQKSITAAMLANLAIAKLRRRASVTSVAAKVAEGRAAYHDLKLLACSAPWPDGVDSTKREQYLAPEVFSQVFGLSPSEFAAFPKWKQQGLKKQHKLF